MYSQASRECVCVCGNVYASTDAATAVSGGGDSLGAHELDNNYYYPLGTVFFMKNVPLEALIVGIVFISNHNNYLISAAFIYILSLSIILFILNILLFILYLIFLYLY